MEQVSCNLCGRERAEPIARPKGYCVVRCRTCGMVYLNPRPAKAELRGLYMEYHERGGGNEKSWNFLMRDVFQEASSHLASCRNGANPGKLLDVGCGYGGFLDRMRDLGWEVEGIDISPTVVDAVARRGLKVRCMALEEYSVDERSFDAISMFYVLEHLPDPVGSLRKAYSLLAPGGALILRVPHTTPVVRILSLFGAGEALYDPPFHLYDFSPKVLRKMLEGSGYKEIRIFPGRHTRPLRFGTRFFTAAIGRAASRLYSASRGFILLPGVSKTAVARKPA